MVGKKNKRKIVGGIFAVGIALVLCGFFLAQKWNLKDKVWLSMHIALVKVQDYEEGGSLWKVENEKEVSFYNLNYQATVERKINSLIKKEKPTASEPLYIINPYGSNTCSVNIYFNAIEPLEASYTVSSKGVPDFSENLYNGTKKESAADYAYQLVGLLPGRENELALHLEGEDGRYADLPEIKITMPESNSEIALQISDIVDGESSKELSNGLFTMLGHDKAWEANTYLYDNEGWLRGEIPLLGYRCDRLELVGENLLFAYSDHDLALMNRLGKIVRKYKFNDYIMHHDHCYNETANTTFVLVSDKATEKEVVEDVVIAIDMESGEVTRLLDFKEIFPEMYEIALSHYNDTSVPAKEKQEVLDWIHFNTVDAIDGEEGTDLILSARELSTVVRINNVLESPAVAYLLSEESVWEETSYQDLVWKEEGNFVSHAGQHTVTYMEDDSLETGQYYLALYNNNFAWAKSRPQFDWSVYPGAGATLTGTENDHSYYYKYLVDENAKSYTLVNSFPVPYSSIVSSVEDMGNGNYVTSSGMSNTFCEYDENGRLIRQYNYDSQKYCYRVFKYTFENFWFQ